ncbi:MAG TPA: amidohydrolase family protein, partial [Gammaproteobacteria bacterium]
MKRREFLKEAGLAGLAFGGGLHAGCLSAQSLVNHAGRIDVHHHYLPPFIDGPTWPWTIDFALEAMDRNNVATSILSGTTFPEPLNDGTPAARDLARRANDWIAEATEPHPGRLGYYAAIPLADTDGSLAEIEYAFDTLNADGVTMNSSAARMWPGDPQQMPIFEELNRRKTSVFLHPNTTPFCCQNPPGVPN